MGYVHPLYAASLSEFGDPVHLPGCDGWLLRRPIPRLAFHDAMGCYPLFCCEDWSRLPADLDNLRGKLVSVALVADPFGNYTFDDLEKGFQRVCHFKRHFVVDLSTEPQIGKHHRYYCRKALKKIQVQHCPDPIQYLDEWTELYQHLIDRHVLQGIKAFSRSSFEKQLRVPKPIIIRALHDGQPVAAHVWYVQGEVAYSHLLAVSPEGYELNASYAVYWEAITRATEIFGPAVRWLNLGAGAGVDIGADDGLTRFKRGWTDVTRPVFFCCRVLDEDKYAALVAATGRRHPAYFPAYREGEFA
jgi:hypothetical protein